jgi:hypothetical protein
MKVLTIVLTLLASGLTAPGASAPAPVTAVKTQMAMIKTALDCFLADCGRYPSTSELAAWPEFSKVWCLVAVALDGG